MATSTELARIAAQATALRPDWPTRSVLTYLERDHATKAYRDLAVAMAYIATDAKTQTPRRLSEAGPWWHTTGEATSTGAPGPNDPRCTLDGHQHELAAFCRICAADARAAGAVDIADPPTLSDEQRATNVAWARAIRDANPRAALHPTTTTERTPA